MAGDTVEHRAALQPPSSCNNFISSMLFSFIKHSTTTEKQLQPFKS